MSAKKVGIIHENDEFYQIMMESTEAPGDAEALQQLGLCTYGYKKRLPSTRHAVCKIAAVGYFDLIENA